MKNAPALILVESEPALHAVARAACDQQGFSLTIVSSLHELHSDFHASPPEVLCIGTARDCRDAAAALQWYSTEFSLQSAQLLLIIGDDSELPQSGTEIRAPEFVSRNCSVREFALRLAVDRLAVKRQSVQVQTQMKVSRLCHASSDRAPADPTTVQLVEIAAQMQVEICHSAKLETEHILSAQTDTIMQAAAALRHEINNPLFAISGSVESAIRKLNSWKTCLTSSKPCLTNSDERSPCQKQREETESSAGKADRMAEADLSDLESLEACLDRIQRGAERIEQVIQSFSTMCQPSIVDYLPGVAMLDLARENADTEDMAQQK